MKFLNNKPNKVLVYGDVILDHYLYGDVTRISPEAPVPIMNFKKEEYKLGGSANVFQNLKSLNCQSKIVTSVGNDVSGNRIVEMLDKHLFVTYDKTKTTPKKTRIISDGQQLLRIDDETTDAISEETEKSLFTYIKNVMNDYNVLILSDYGKGCFPSMFTTKLIDEANKNRIIVLVDPHNGNLSKSHLYSNATCVKANKKQAEQISGIKINSIDDAGWAADYMIGHYNLKYAVITLSENGLVIKEKNKPYRHILGRAKEVYDVTGAGDTTIACFGWALSSGYDLYDAAEIANAGGNIKVQHHGTYAVTYEDLKTYFDGVSKIVSVHNIRNILKDCKKIVFVNGCFDILHPGHIAMLQFAKSQGDKLVVGLNSDRSVKKLKGEDRPKINENDRAKVLSSLECVDYVCIFDEDTPHNLIQEIEPHVHVKGSDHAGETEGVQNTIFFDRVGNYSTTNLIK